jgi:hypothetical protein
MAKKNTPKEPKKKHHRMKKLVAFAALAGAAYGAKKLVDSRRAFRAKKV